MNPSAQITTFIKPSRWLVIEVLLGYHDRNRLSRGVIMTNANSDVPALEHPSLETRLQVLVEAGLIEWSGHRMSLATAFPLYRSLC